MVEDELHRAKSTKFHVVHPTPANASYYTTLYRSCRFADHLVAHWVAKGGSKGPYGKLIPTRYIRNTQEAGVFPKPPQQQRQRGQAGQQQYDPRNGVAAAHSNNLNRRASSNDTASGLPVGCGTSTRESGGADVASAAPARQSLRPSLPVRARSASRVRPRSSSSTAASAAARRAGVLIDESAGVGEEGSGRGRKVAGGGGSAAEASQSPAAKAAQSGVYASDNSSSLRTPPQIQSRVKAIGSNTEPKPDGKMRRGGRHQSALERAPGGSPLPPRQSIHNQQDSHSPTPTHHAHPRGRSEPPRASAYRGGVADSPRSSVPSHPHEQYNQRRQDKAATAAMAAAALTAASGRIAPLNDPCCCCWGRRQCWQKLWKWRR